MSIVRSCRLLYRTRQHHKKIQMDNSYPVSRIPYPVSRILYPVSRILYPVSCILYPVSSRILPYPPVSSRIHQLASGLLEQTTK